MIAHCGSSAPPPKSFQMFLRQAGLLRRDADGVQISHRPDGVDVARRRASASSVSLRT